jgi:hypothetical protein
MDLVQADSDLIYITRKEYDDLCYSRRVLDALYAGGVDNWEWYGDSLSEIDDDD